ncbi:MAG TPA: ABC transporter ATP-binding protein [Acetobacteraceae bacterium]
MTVCPIAVRGRDLVKTFGGHVRALDGVSVDIREGEFFTLLGPSGCGKTTLLRLIGGFEAQDSGSIELHGRRLDGLPPHRRPVNTVFQSYAVFPHMSVARNIGFGLEMQRRKRSEIAARVAEMLALVKLEALAGRKPGQLSGGQRQRVALARALAPAPQVLLLDEPLSALDLQLRSEMQLELKRLQSALGITFIFVTHDQGEALAMSDRIGVMNGGRLEQVGTPEEIYEHPANRFVAGFIGESNLLPAEPLGGRRFRIASGEVLEADRDGPGDTLALRPERAALVAPGAGQLAGRVEQVVYLGTDTAYHLALDGGLRLVVREQNRAGATPRARPGEAVGVSVPAEALRVLPG